MKTKRDFDLSFSVGSREVHQVHFHWAWGPAEAVIDVDGTEVLRERHFFGMKSVRRYEVPVGVSEIHKVAIEKRKIGGFGGVRQQTFRIFVDGSLIEEHQEDYNKGLFGPAT